MGSYYNISTAYDNAIYERSDENYYIVNIQNYLGNALVDPSAVKVEITDPCGSSVVTLTDMTKLSTGVYVYNHSIDDDALYGEYVITVTASSPTYTSVYKDKFFILPWEASYDVRQLSGITSKKTISEHSLAQIIWESYKEALDEVYEYHANTTPKCNPDTGSWFDGVNTTFATSHSPIADSDGNGFIQGYGEASCATDIDGWWKDCDGDCHRVKITVNEPHCGNITITKLDGTPIPSSMQWVHLNYSTEWYTFDSYMFKQAVCYLSAHKCIVRFHELERATLADVHSNRQEILAHRDRMKVEYIKALNQIRKPVIGAGMKPGA